MSTQSYSYDSVSPEDEAYATSYTTIKKTKPKLKDADWSEVTNPEERRRIQNRVAQRKFSRFKLLTPIPASPLPPSTDHNSPFLPFAIDFIFSSCYFSSKPHMVHNGLFIYL